MKSFLKSILPPILLDAKNKIIRKIKGNVPKTSPKEFRVWWNKYSSSNDIPQDLTNMMDAYIETKAFINSSGYWRNLCTLHVELLVENGIENYKQTIEKRHYWGEASLESRLLKPIINDTVGIDIDTQMIFKQHEYCSINESVQHNTANVILLNYIFDNQLEGYLELMEESKFGNPITISLDFNLFLNRFSFNLIKLISLLFLCLI